MASRPAVPSYTGHAHSLQGRGGPHWKPLCWDAAQGKGTEGTCQASLDIPGTSRDMLVAVGKARQRTQGTL